MNIISKKNFDAPDQTAQPVEKVKIDTVEVNGVTLQRVTVQPSWRWSVDFKPVHSTDSCQTDHLLYMVSGKMGARMLNSKKVEFGPGDIVAIPPGHDGWCIGDQPVVWIELPH